MADERTTVTENTTADPVHPADTTRHTTVVTEKRSGGSGWVIALIVLLIAAAVGYFALRASDAEVAKDNAVENAANQVGSAAESVGDAAQDAADNLGN